MCVLDVFFFSSLKAEKEAKKRKPEIDQWIKTIILPVMAFLKVVKMVYGTS